MRRRAPKRDPAAAYRRKVVAARRVGVGACCHKCGENRPEALIAGSLPALCAKCERLGAGYRPNDAHHPFGYANSPITIEVPVNDHRAQLNVAQADWPKVTLANLAGSPLLAAAACIRGFIDTTLYLIEKGLLWVAEMLEMFDAMQVKRLGPRWWLHTEIEQFAPKKKSNGRRT